MQSQLKVVSLEEFGIPGPYILREDLDAISDLLLRTQMQLIYSLQRLTLDLLNRAII